MRENDLDYDKNQRALNISTSEAEKNRETGYGCLSFMLGIGASFLYALYFKIAWSLVVVPTLSINPLTYWQAVGLLTFIRMFTGNNSFSKDTNQTMFYKLTVRLVVMSVLMFLIWLISLGI